MHITPATVLLVVIVSFLFYYLFKLCHTLIHPFLPSPLKKIPTPKPTSWIAGSIPEMTKKPPLELLVEWGNTYKDSPLVHYYFLWNYDRVLVTDPEVVKQVLSEKNFSKRELPGYGLLKFALGDGLITQNTTDHEKHRKLINPAFRHGNLKDYIQVFSDQTQVLIDFLSKEKDGNTVSVNELMNKVTLNIIGTAAFGFDFSAFGDDKSTIGYKTYEAFSSLINFHSWVTAFIPIAKWLPFPNNIRAGLNLLYMNRVVLELVKSKRKRLSEQSKFHDILDILIASRDEETGFSLSDNQLRAHVKTFLGAGHETTSTMLTWTLYLLSQHPNVRAKLVEEITQVLGDRSDFTYADIEKLSYMNFVFKESMRLYPPVAIVARRVEENIQLGGYEVPKNTIVLVCPLVLGRSEKLWENPLVFNPDRWENADSYHPFQFVPFLKGPRNCIGQKFALLEGKVILAMLLRKFNFTMSKEAFDKVTTAHHVTLRPEGDLFMQIHHVK